jgi:hypothetical protein
MQTDGFRRFSFNDAAKAFKTTKDSKGPDGNLAIKVISQSFSLTDLAGWLEN